jgi:hypothetical protein
MHRFMLLKTTDDFGMGGSNCAELYCTILKNGSLSLRTCINQYEYGRWYFKSVRGIKTPKQFLEALKKMEGIREQYTDDEVLDALFKILPLFAIHTKVYMRLSESKTGEYFFNQAYPLLKKIDVDLQSEFSKAVSLFDVIYNYVQIWFEKHKCLPTGEHQILNYVVIFPAIK